MMILIGLSLRNSHNHIIRDPRGDISAICPRVEQRNGQPVLNSVHLVAAMEPRPIWHQEIEGFAAMDGHAVDQVPPATGFHGALQGSDPLAVVIEHDERGVLDGALGSISGPGLPYSGQEALPQGKAVGSVGGRCWVFPVQESS